MAKRIQEDHEQSTDIRGLLDDLEDRIERLKVSYEKYFVGVDRVPPTRDHDRVSSLVRHIMKLSPRSTALRFRMQGLRARLVSYSHYWNRVLGEIERGTFHRDLKKLARKQARQQDEAKVNDKPKKPAAARGDGADAHTALGMSAGEMRKLFKDLVTAKRAAGESTNGLSYAALVRKLAREAPKLRDQHGCEAVRFEVSTKGGKVRLRGKPGAAERSER